MDWVYLNPPYTPPLPITHKLSAWTAPKLFSASTRYPRPFYIWYTFIFFCLDHSLTVQCQYWIILTVANILPYLYLLMSTHY